MVFLSLYHLHLTLYGSPLLFTLIYPPPHDPWGSPRPEAVMGRSLAKPPESAWLSYRWLQTYSGAWHPCNVHHRFGNAAVFPRVGANCG